MESVFCPKEGASYLILSDQVPFLLYYSHLPVIILSLLFGLFLFIQAKRNIQSVIILLVVVLYSCRSFFDLITWATNDSRQVMFFWSLQIFFELSIYVACAYLVYVFLRRRDVPWAGKTLLFAPLATLAVMLPTSLTLSSMVLDDACEAVEGFVAIQYVYGVEAILLIWMIVFFFYSFLKTKDRQNRKQQFFFMLGLAAFLISFSWGNIAGSLLENWELAQYGEFGMPIFIALLAYIVVKYRAFNAKLLSVQALVWGLIILVGSLLFFIRDPLPYLIIALTLVLLIIFSRILVVSVSEEIRRKEELQKLTDQLASANQELKRLDVAKSEFISIASHQLRTPLTAIKGYVSLLLEGSYGQVLPAVQDVLNKVYLVNNRMGQLVEDLLSISRIESGRVQYNFVPAQLEPIVADAVDMFALMAKERGLYLKIKLPKQSLPQLSLDVNKIREVISNLIDNALKYTREGGVTVSVKHENGLALVSVADTGIGVDSKDAERLFEKFTRSSETMKLDVSGTGLGLYVGKNFVEAHGGTLRVESSGPGKGACFIISIPFVSTGKID